MNEDGAIKTNSTRKNPGSLYPRKEKRIMTYVDDVYAYMCLPLDYNCQAVLRGINIVFIYDITSSKIVGNIT